MRLDVRRSFEGDVTFRGVLAARRHDFRTVEYTAGTATGQGAGTRYEVVTRNGRNPGQREIRLDPSDVPFPDHRPRTRRG